MQKGGRREKNDTAGGFDSVNGTTGKRAAACISGGSEVSAQTQQKPNIVYILTDDLDTYTLNQVETTRSLLPLANPLLLPGARSHTPRVIRGIATPLYFK